jgi:hypothetical protein
MKKTLFVIMLFALQLNGCGNGSNDATEKPTTKLWSQGVQSASETRKFYEEGSVVRSTSDGGIILGAMIKYGASAGIIKYNADGNQEYSVGLSFSGSGISIKDILTEKDKTVILCQLSISVSGQIDDFYWMVVLDSKGQEVWQKMYLCNGSSGYPAKIVSGKNGYAIAGTISEKESTNNKDVFILHLDKNGNVIWQFSYDISSIDYATGIVSHDDGFIVIGNSRGNGNNVFFLKIKEDGTCKDGVIIYKNNTITIESIATNGTNIAAVGHYEDSIKYDFLAITFDLDGNIQNSMAINQKDMQSSGRSVRKTSTGFISSGISDNAGRNYDGILLKISSEGNLQGDIREFDFSREDFFDSVDVSGHGFVITGSIFNKKDNVRNILFLKVNKDLDDVGTVGIIPEYTTWKPTIQVERVIVSEMLVDSYDINLTGAIKNIEVENLDLAKE